MTAQLSTLEATVKRVARDHNLRVTRVADDAFELAGTDEEIGFSEPILVVAFGLDQDGLTVLRCGEGKRPSPTPVRIQWVTALAAFALAPLLLTFILLSGPFTLLHGVAAVATVVVASLRARSMLIAYRRTTASRERLHAARRQVLSMHDDRPAPP